MERKHQEMGPELMRMHNMCVCVDVATLGHFRAVRKRIESVMWTKWEEMD